MADDDGSDDQEVTDLDPAGDAQAEAADAARSAPQSALDALGSHEPQRHPLVIGLVAPLGAPVAPVITAIERSLHRCNYEFEHVKLSALLDVLEYQPWGVLPTKTDPDYYERRMNAGDQLRSDIGNGSALAAVAIGRVAELREERTGNIAVLLDSLKHKDEVELLRHVYGAAFTLVAVASTLDERLESLADSLAPFENAKGEAQRLIQRDEFDSEKSQYGQDVRHVYAMADVYVPARSGQEPGPDVDRFVDSLFGAPFITPSINEEGMRLAFDASLRSAAIGRQVGAALIPQMGTPVVVGTNEVPKPGGGQYWDGDVPDFRDFQTGRDPNPAYTRLVIIELLDRLCKRNWIAEELRELSGPELYDRALETGEDGKSILDGARAEALIEFTRCLHAEQAAIVNAARAGVSTEGASLYTTTFPCHECAKIIVGAGIVDLFYIEPYPKSMVSHLYRDVIDVAPPIATDGGLVNGKVPFRPFVGIAPRRYATAFQAGARGARGDLIDFDLRSACPKTDGWSEAAIRERESGAVDAISRLVAILASRAATDEATGAEVPEDTGAEEPGTPQAAGAPEG
jgi:deoxycytidylate deaminase